MTLPTIHLAQPFALIGAANRVGIIAGNDEYLKGMPKEAMSRFRDIDLSKLAKGLNDVEKRRRFHSVVHPLMGRSIPDFIEDESGRTYLDGLLSLPSPASKNRIVYDPSYHGPDYTSENAISNFEYHFFGSDRKHLVYSVVDQAMQGGFRGIVYGTRRSGKTNFCRYVLDKLEQKEKPPITVFSLMRATPEVYFDPKQEVTIDRENPYGPMLDQLIRIGHEKPVFIILDEMVAVFQKCPDFFVRWREAVDQGSKVSLLILSYIVEEQLLRHMEDAHHYNVTRLNQRDFRSYSLNSVERKTLPPMSTDDIGEMTAQYLFGDQAIPDFSSAYLESMKIYTGGNPLVVKILISRLSSWMVFGTSDLNADQSVSEMLWGQSSTEDFLMAYREFFDIHYGYSNTVIQSETEGRHGPFRVLIDRALEEPDFGFDDALLQDPKFYELAGLSALIGQGSDLSPEQILDANVRYITGMMESLSLIGFMRKVPKAQGGFRYRFMDVPALVSVNRNRPGLHPKTQVYSAEMVRDLRQLNEIDGLPEDFLDRFFTFVSDARSAHDPRQFLFESSEKLQAISGGLDKVTAVVSWIRSLEKHGLLVLGDDQLYYDESPLHVILSGKDSHTTSEAREPIPYAEIIKRVLRNIHNPLPA